MTSSKPEKVAKTSANIEDENLQKLRAVFPNFVKDGVIDFDALRAFFDKEGTLAGTEKYGLNWAGKNNAFKAIRTPSTGTLTPDEKESKNFDDTENIFIEGDNMEVLKLLQKHYREQIKVIYIDPPYNTGKDFIYTDNFTENKNNYYERTGQSCDGIKLTSNPESNGRYHSDWLTMMYPRLFLARNLLCDDGVVFISIDDHEVANLRMIMDEIFGEENFVESIVWNKRVPKNDKGIGNIHEYVLIYVKNADHKHEFVMAKEGLEDIDELLLKLKSKRVPISEAEEEIAKLYKKKGYDRGVTLYNSLDDDYRLWGKINMSWPNANSFGPQYQVIHPKTKKPVKVPERGWRWTEESFDDAAGIVDGKYSDVKELHDGTFLCNRIWFAKDEKIQPSSVIYLENVETFLLRSILSQKSDGGIELENIFEGKSFFSYPKPTTLVKTLLASFPFEDNGIILDFFAGSGTTAHAVMDLNAEDGGNRKWICVQIPEGTNADSEACKAGYLNIAQISRERIRRAGAKIAKGDTGFKAFSLSSSNYSEWNVLTDKDDEATLKKQSKLFLEQPLVAGFDEKSVVYEILLKEGFDLNAKVEQSKGDLAPWIVTTGEKKLVITFAKKVTKSQVEALDLIELDTIICLDSALDDTAKVNIMRNLTLKTI